MRRPDAVKAAKARRYAHRAARIGAKREIAGLGGHGRGRSARRAARHAAGRRRVQRRTVMRVLAEKCRATLRRLLVLPDDRGAGIEQGLHGPCVTGRRGGERGQSGLPPPVRHAGHARSDSLTAKLRPATGPAAAPAGTCAAGPAQTLPVKVMTLSGLARCPRHGGEQGPWYRNAAD